MRHLLSVRLRTRSPGDGRERQEESMAEMRIKTMVLGAVQTNCYLIYDEETRRGFLVDPADESEKIEAVCTGLGVKPEAILLTHGHGDHILAAEDLKKKYGIPVLAGAGERELMADPSLNLSAALGMGSVALRADRELKNGEELEVAGFRLKVLETPGHTRGSVCYLDEAEKVLISGDTLFEESLGRTDFPTGSVREIVDSISGVLFALPEDTMVYPGHGNPTTIGHEKVYNPVAMYRR